MRQTSSEQPIDGGTSSATFELLGLEPLEEHARRLAALLTVTRGPRGGARSHLKRLEQNLSALTSTYTALADDVRRGEPAIPAVEWLLDNFHIVSSAALDIIRDLPPSFFRRLPTVAADEFARSPRVSALAFELIRSSAGQLSAQRLQRFIAAFQSVTPLTIGELWAWPSALKLALIEYLRGRADVLAAAREHRAHADRLADALEQGVLASAQWPERLHPAFVARLLQRSREYGAAASPLSRQLAEELSTRGLTVEDAIRSEGRHQAAEQASMANLIGSLRLTSSFDWSEFFESVSLVEHALQRDPVGVYSRMDFQSRDRYRRAVEELSEPTGEGQLRVALKCVERARRAAQQRPDARDAHVGHYLIGSGRRHFETSVAWVPTVSQRVRRFFFASATPAYLGAIGVGTALLVAAALVYALRQGWRGGVVFIIAFTLIPATELAIQLVQHILSHLIPPNRLPRLELTEVPASSRTMVIVPTLFESAEQVRELLAHLEVQALGNVDPHVHFAVLSDFRDAATQTLPRDAEILAEARAGIDTLNRKHGDGRPDRFFLFHRQRQWNEREGLWMGWERKRGKIEEFNRLLRGATDTSFTVTVGDLSLLPEMRYCITLDSDTHLPRDTARQLIGIIAHPLNRPVFDAELGRVTQGYGILQPRVSVTFASAAGSLFARVYSGHTGVDPYTTAVSDTYQDLFGEGIFTGKGLYDVDAFNAALADTVPENALLSHDLFEGLHARVALVSDVELVDEYPSSVLTHARRQHRWIRGDWQILFWLLPFVPSPGGLRRNTLPLVARWKILDNLRRSLVSPTLLALLIAGWTVLPGSVLVWMAMVLGVLASPLLPVVSKVLTGRRRSQPLAVYFRNLARDTASALAQIGISLTLLAFNAFQTVHAIGLTVVRLSATKRRLLEWETAASAAAKAVGLVGQRGLWRFAAEMVSSPVIAASVLVVLLVARREALPAAASFLLLWAVAPGVAYWLSVPVGARVRPLNDDARLQLRAIARQTWRYFETLVTEAEGWLVPDNIQEQDDGLRIARRTSPTNVAMSLLSTLAAHDLGYLTTDGLLVRLRGLLTTLEGLERYRGHFLNWYDTATRAPLQPRYVSTVDSGNLAAALGALAQGLFGLAEQPQTRATLLSGLADTAGVLAMTSSAARGVDTTATAVNLLAREIVTAARNLSGSEGTEQLARLAVELRTLGVGDVESAAGTAVNELAFWCRAVIDAIDNLDASPLASPATCDALARRAARLADEMRFDFLYDRRRRIFAIGYRLADADGPGRLDDAFYDLLASEARLASFVAIVKGDVPQHHWFNLGRPVTSVNGRATLVSWGGTMFEYLMPLLLMRSYAGTLLDQSCRAALQAQIEYARTRGVPWGISESAYAFTDRSGNYQYPGLWRAGARAEARARGRSRRRAVRHGAGQPGESRCGRRQLRSTRQDRVGGSVWIPRVHRFPAPRQDYRHRPK